MTMSPTQDPDTEPINKGRLGEKQRAAIVLAVIAVGAVVLVVIMLSVLGTSDNSDGPPGIANPTGPAVTVTGGAPPSNPSGQASSPRTQTSASSAAGSTPPSNRPVSCPTQAPCTLPDDIGNVIGALNAYRASHGQPPVTGKVTQAAQTCAVSSGDTCPDGFFWEPVGRSGQQVLSKITDSGSGSSAMLDPKLTTIQVGWAYIPASQSFECAVITNGG